MLIPRDYQLAAVEAVRREHKQHRSTVLVLATGLGKTVIAAMLALLETQGGGRVLFVAHRRELLAQALRKFAEAGVRAELEQASNHADRSAPVVVASVDTLRGKRLASWDPDAFSLVVIDEAHRALAAGYVSLVGHFTRARVLGLTATPDRLDGKALGDAFQSCAYRYDLREGIRDKHLVPVRARRVELQSVDLSGVRTVGGDLDEKQLAAAMRAEEALHGAAIPLLEQSRDRRTLAFTVDVAHAHDLARVLNHHEPGVATVIDGVMGLAEREARLSAYRRGDVRVLCNCMLLVEGFDDPPTSCIAMLRPTKSRGLYTQVVGRATRLSPETGKRDALVLDLTAGRAGKHRLVGPVDVLAGGDVRDPVREELNQLMLAAPVDVDAALAEAEQVVSERVRASATSALAAYIAKEIDPFVGDIEPALRSLLPGELFDNIRDENAAARGEPATPGQQAALKALGLDNLPSGITASEAGRWLGALKARKDAGLCSLKQARLLRRAGYANTERLTASEAGRLIPNVLARYSAQKSMRRAGGIA